MLPFENPALAAWLSEFGHGRVFGLVAILPAHEGWELRAAADRAAPATALRTIDLAEVRRIAQHTTAGAFRPLKSAPNLVHGWRLPVATVGELGEALERLHPGAVADWFAVTQGTATPTSYETFTARQSGMYRITTFLDGEQAADVARACCHESFCVKRRMWGAGELRADDAGGKSAIPCLEPCAPFLEFARAIARLTKDNAIALPVVAAEATAQLREVEAALARPDPAVRAADFATPENPRRLRWLREKLARVADEAERPTS